MKKKRKSSGIIIIGNEILSGKTLDTNSNFMCNELFKKGISCDEINITRDEELRIIEKIDLFKSKYDYVFTSGGIGPTHDDITSKSVAKAFGQKLVLNKEAKELCKNIIWMMT
jgi:molybdenum cofactor synthesis domain-containing protein